MEEAVASEDWEQVATAATKLHEIKTRMDKIAQEKVEKETVIKAIAGPPDMEMPAPETAGGVTTLATTSAEAAGSYQDLPADFEELVRLMRDATVANLAAVCKLGNIMKMKNFGYDFFIDNPKGIPEFAANKFN